MAIRDSILYQDIINLITNRINESDTRFKYTLEIIYPYGTVGVSKVHSVQIARDFVSRYSDYITLAISVTRLSYDNILYPFREQLQARLTVESVDDKVKVEGGKKATRLYRLKLSEYQDDRLMYGDSNSPDDAAKSQELKDIGVQLIDTQVESLRIKGISGVARNTNMTELLYTMMSNGGTIPMELHPPDNNDSIEQLIIEDGTKLIDFPMWLQKYGGGVYNHNLGCYIMQGWLHLYPLFATERTPNRRKVILCSVGPGQLDGIDNTYVVDDSLITDDTYRYYRSRVNMVSTGKVEVDDTTERLEYEHGNAIRFTKPNFMDDALTHDNGITKATGAGYVTYGFNKSTLNNSVVQNLVTNNYCYEVSRINSNRGLRASFVWENANPSLILPNTEITVLYKSGDTINSYQGLIIGMDYESKAVENDGINVSHVGNAILHTILEKNPK